MDAFPASSTNEFYGVIDDAGLEEGGNILLDGFDAPGKRAYERVLDRPRNRSRKRRERCSLE